MGYLLDTCVLSDFVRGEAGTQAKLRATLPSEIYVSAITVMEVRYGLRINPQQAARIGTVMNELIDSATIVRFDSDVATCAAEIRARLKAAGTPIGAYDVLIAATALQHELIMVTANTREFVRVVGLQLENWRLPQERTL
jgi:tRNA(fMet)-specific endonuclease VapC